MHNFDTFSLHLSSLHHQTTKTLSNEIFFEDDYDCHYSSFRKLNFLTQFETYFKRCIKLYKFNNIQMLLELILSKALIKSKK